MAITTVAQAAAYYKVSRQAVYGQLAKLSNKGKDKRTGLLTDEAIRLLDTVYQAKEQDAINLTQADLQLANDKLQEKNDALAVEIDRFKAQVASMQEEINKTHEMLNMQKQANEVLSIKVESLQGMIDTLRSERDFLRTQLDKAITPALPAGEQKKSPAGFVAWLRNMRK